MITCPSCSADNPETSKFCSDCGGALKTELEATVTHAQARKNARGDSSELSDSDSSHHGRFLPGTRLANRYRIVSLLGKGGMGEVYQADDLKLGQTVALKFLPKELANDTERLEYFRNEVRLARQISHPNVCRVYDIGEVDGQHFLSMEFIDGEDLRSLLRRIGRLPSDKGLEISAQLCAGLAAAHDKNVVHRDLKPANIMIDGRGRVRITDFGLASQPNTETTHEELAGTPAYMAPEQLLTGETSVQSDLYSLGLILYELFTGRSPHGKSTIGELRKVHRQDSDLSPPSEFLKDIDPTVERAILRCLERAPENRPRSAAGVAAALPGGDPLAAAMAAGETPSPEVVAAAGETGGLHPAIGGALLALVVLGLFCIAWLFDRWNVVGIVRTEINTPEVMASKARTILADLGYSQASRHSAHWYWYDVSVLNRIMEQNGVPELRDFVGARPTPILFVYRQSPRPMRPFDATSLQVHVDDPPLNVPGMVRITLNLDGRLQRFWAVPPATDDEIPQTKEPDWRTLFRYAGIPDDFERVDTSTVVPPHYADARLAWEGVLSEDRVRIEAAFHSGKPVSFRIIPDWYGNPIPRLSMPIWLSAPIQILRILFVLTAIVLAWRNLRSGRSDWKGAIRIGLVVYFSMTLSYILQATSLSEVLVLDALPRIVRMLSANIYVFAAVLILYGAIEPFARRFWPQTLIAWSRLLSGRFTDPRVGREVLVGATLGIVVSVVFHLSNFFHSAGGGGNVQLDSILGNRYVLGWLVRHVGAATIVGLVLLFILLLMRLVLRRGWLAGVAFVSALPALGAVAHLASTSNNRSALFLLTVLSVAMLLTGVVFVVTRYGLVAMLTALYCILLLTQLPVTADTSVWFWEKSSILVVGVITALACFGFLTSLKGWTQTSKTAADL